MRGLVKVKKTEIEEEIGDDEQLPLIGSDELVLDKITRDTARQYKESKEIRQIGFELVKLIAKPISPDDPKKRALDKDFNPKQLQAAVGAFKAGSEDMREIERLIDDGFNPQNESDEELERIVKSK